MACRRRRPQTKVRSRGPSTSSRPACSTDVSSAAGAPQRSHSPVAGGSGRRAVHRETRRRPIDLHAEELPYLIPLLKSPMTRRRWSTARSTPKGWWPTGRTSTRSLAVSGADVAAADHGRRTDRLRPGSRGAGPAPGVAACHDRPAKRVARASSPGRLQTAGSSFTPAIRRVGTAASRFLEGLLKTHRMAKTRQAGCWRWSRPIARRTWPPPWSGRHASGLLLACGRTHPRGAGPAENAAGIARRPTARTLARYPPGSAGSATPHRRLRTTLSRSAGAARR